MTSMRRGRIERQDRKFIEEILPKEIIAHLSQNARIVYPWIFSMIALKGGRFGLISDMWLHRRTKIPVVQLAAAAAELVSIGLIRIEHGLHPSDTPDTRLKYYRFVADEQQD